MIEDFAEYLVGEQRNPTAILIEILGQDYESWDFVAAVEGADDRRFFHDFLTAHFADAQISIFECGGKLGVLRFKEAAEQYPWRKTPRLLYFCDRDFDDFLGSQCAGTFLTKYYSIESYFIDVDFVGYVVDRFREGPVSAECRSLLLEEYQRLFQAALRAARFVCAYMMCIRGTGKHPDFDLIGLDVVYHFGNDQIRPRKDVLASLAHALKLDDPIPVSRIGRAARDFGAVDHRYWLRGKLGMQLARKCYSLALNRIDEESRAVLPDSNYFGKQGFDVAFGYLQQLEGFAEYCDGVGG